MSTKSKKKVTKVTKKKAAVPRSAVKAKKFKVHTEELQPEGINKGKGKGKSGMGRPVRKSKPATIHIRTAQAKDSETFCGGSHSPIWNREGDKPLTSVPPSSAAKATCGRCTRVYDARMRKGKVAA